jgi:hypothetical protein
MELYLKFAVIKYQQISLSLPVVTMTVKAFKPNDIQKLYKMMVSILSEYPPPLSSGNKKQGFCLGYYGKVICWRLYMPMIPF